MVVHIFQQFCQPFSKKDNPVVYEQNICVVRKNLVLRIKVVFKVEGNSDLRYLGEMSLYLDSHFSISVTRIRSGPVAGDQCSGIRSVCIYLVGITRRIPSSSPFLSKYRHPGETFLLSLSFLVKAPIIACSGV